MSLTTHSPLATGWRWAPVPILGARLMTLPVALPVGAVSGFLLDSAFADVGWWPMAWLSVAAVLAGLVGRSPQAALLVGLIFGAAFFLSHLWWVEGFLGPIPWLALATLQTVLMGAGSLLISLVYRWTGSTRSQLVLVPALVGGVWTLREIVMGAWPYSGFPWARLAVSQVNGPVAETVSWLGMTGMSFVMVAVCAAAIQVLRLRLVGERPPVAPLLVAAVVLVVTPSFPTSSVGEFRVGWVQGNGPSGYFDDRSAGDVLAAQTAATASINGQQTDVVVWPEGSVDSDPLVDRRTAAALDGVSRRSGAPLLVNAATNREPASFNTSLLWQPGRAVQLYDKMNPVPFGEYVPDRWFWEMLAPQLVGLIQRDYRAGSIPPRVNVDGVTIGLAICFDVIYDDVIWAGVREGAQLYVFQTNNADFRGSDENLQQLAFARMRALETGRAVVNVSTVGTSQVIGADGTVVDTLGIDQAGARITAVERRTGLTPASVVGPSLGALIGWGSLLALVLSAALAHRRSLVLRRTPGGSS